MQRATRLELAAFSHENIALHRPSQLHRFRPDLTAYARVLPDRERSRGIDCALHLAVDEQLVQEFDRAFDRNSSGKKSGAWDDRWVWPIRFRGFSKVGKRLHDENCAELLALGKRNQKRELRRKAAVNLRDFGQRLIPTGERSGLQTRIAATKSVSLRGRMKSWRHLSNWKQRFATCGELT
jgi:hypothetical protein